MKELLEIDGSHGEGGGQILRSALSLSLATGRPFRMTRIRAGRAKPGLMRQHLTCVLAAQRVSGAKVVGAELGAQALEFRPGPLEGGDYTIEIGTAGSTVMVAQSLLPAFIARNLEVRLEIHGGTHNPMAPPYSALEHVIAPLLGRLGVPLTTTLLRPGFMRMGGGAFELVLGPKRTVAPLRLETRGALTGVTVEVLTSSLPDDIATRELEVVRARLGSVLDGVPIDEHHLSPSKNHWRSTSVGNAIAVMLHFEGHTEEVSMLGEPRRIRFARRCDERHLSAERVAALVVDKALAFLAHGQPVGEHLQDQLPILLAATVGGRYRTIRPTLHLQSQLELLPRFTGQPIRVEPSDDGILVEVDPMY